MDTITTTDNTTPEAVLAARLNVPRDKLKRWRDNGDLKRLLHYIKEGNAYHITQEGEAKVLRLIGVEKPPLAPEKVWLRVQAAGAMPRNLRCKPMDGGPMVTVRLTGPRVFATQFRRNDCIEVMPTDVDGIYEYDGAAPRRVRL